MAKELKVKMTDAEQVELYMKNVKHGLKEEMNAVRKIIKGVDKRINERIKWNAPSYYFLQQDMVTFGPVRDNRILLVFHHPYVVKIESYLLEGDYKDRRLMYFNNMNEIKANRKELIWIMTELVKAIDGKSK